MTEENKEQEQEDKGFVFPPPPSWLDPLEELKSSGQPEEYSKLADSKKAISFILLSIKCLKIIGSKDLTDDAIISLVANSVVETGWGRYWKGWNFGGWKINKSDVDSFKKLNNGKCPPWWQAKGHTKSGDDPVCYYRGFFGPVQYYQEWIKRFVPKSGSVSPSHRYKKTGEAFWSGKDWFSELIQAGYKGAVTKANPGPSIRAHEKIIESIKTRVAQQLLGVESDGKWGKMSIAACNKFQEANGLQKTLSPDDATVFLLIKQWELNKDKQGRVMTLPFDLDKVITLQ